MPSSIESINRNIINKLSDLCKSIGGEFRMENDTAYCKVGDKKIKVSLVKADKISIKEMKKILDDMLKKSKGGFEDSEWYEPLIKIGVLKDEYDEIISDPYYDAEAVAFARKILDFVEVD